MILLLYFIIQNFTKYMMKLELFYYINIFVSQLVVELPTPRAQQERAANNNRKY